MNSSTKPFYKSKKFISLFGAIITILAGVPISSYANNQLASLAITLAVSILEAFYLYLQGNIDIASVNNVIDNTLPIIEQTSPAEIAKIAEASKPLVENAVDQAITSPEPVQIAPVAPALVEAPVQSAIDSTPPAFVENLTPTQPDPQVVPINT
jgi:hypothetical protein